MKHNNISQKFFSPKKKKLNKIKQIERAPPDYLSEKEKGISVRLCGHISHLLAIAPNLFSVCACVPEISLTTQRTYESYQKLEEDFVAGQLHPGDLKPAVAKALNDLIEPVRQHFINDPDARELLKKIQSY